jgi:hypothetical protein
MSKMLQLVEEMRARLNEIAETEQARVQALGQALSHVDQRLLQDVQNVTTEHEARRGSILHELQELAARMGAFPAAPDAMAGLEYGDSTPSPSAAANDVHPLFTRGGRWPQVASSVEEGIVAAYPTARTPTAGLEYTNAASMPGAGGDWRQAANNIADELDLCVEKRAALR